MKNKHLIIVLFSFSFFVFFLISCKKNEVEKQKQPEIYTYAANYQFHFDSIPPGGYRITYSKDKYTIKTVLVTSGLISGYGYWVQNELCPLAQGDSATFIIKGKKDNGKHRAYIDYVASCNHPKTDIPTILNEKTTGIEVGDTLVFDMSCRVYFND